MYADSSCTRPSHSDVTEVASYALAQVYIPVQGVREDDLSKLFEANLEKSPAFDLLGAVDYLLFGADDCPDETFKKYVDARYKNDGRIMAQLLLLAGPAGSGKSTFVNELELHILSHYHKKRQEQGVDVLLLRVSLPTLRNPLSDLFEEALKSPPMSMKDKQIADLRTLIKQGHVEVVFLLDAYDELQAQVRVMEPRLTRLLPSRPSPPVACVHAVSLEEPLLLQLVLGVPMSGEAVRGGQRAEAGGCAGAELGMLPEGDHYHAKRVA